MLSVKAQSSPLNLIFVVFVGMLMWIYWAGQQLTYWGQQAITQNGMTGLEALIFANLNVTLFFAFVLVLLAAIAIGGNN
jgi:hypothetical protein